MIGDLFGVFCFVCVFNYFKSQALPLFCFRCTKHTVWLFAPILCWLTNTDLRDQLIPSGSGRLKAKSLQGTIQKITGKAPETIGSSVEVLMGV